jgi:hypothetical protein
MASKCRKASTVEHIKTPDKSSAFSNVRAHLRSTENVCSMGAKKKGAGNSSRRVWIRENEKRTYCFTLAHKTSRFHSSRGSDASIFACPKSPENKSTNMLHATLLEANCI